MTQPGSNGPQSPDRSGGENDADDRRRWGNTNPAGPANQPGPGDRRDQPGRLGQPGQPGQGGAGGRWQGGPALGGLPPAAPPAGGTYGRSPGGAAAVPPPAARPTSHRAAAPAQPAVPTQPGATPVQRATGAPGPGGPGGAGALARPAGSPVLGGAGLPDLNPAVAVGPLGATATPAAPAGPASAAPPPGAPAAGRPVSAGGQTAMLAPQPVAGTVAGTVAPPAATAGQVGSAVAGTAATVALRADATRQAAGGALATPGSPAGPGSGTVYGAGFLAEQDEELRNRLPSLPKLHIGSHVASEAALDVLSPTSPGMGLLLGYDRDRQPAMVRLFRPEPTRVTVVGGLWISQVMVFRALALGARVVVFTDRPEAWEGFGQWATGRPDRVAVLPSERPVTVAASSLVPALLMYDGGLLGASARPTLGPWQTQLTVLRQLTAFGFPAAQESNLVALQRLSAEEAYSLGSVLRLSQQTIPLLQVLRDDMLALFGGGADRYIWVTPTAAEQRQFGSPHR